MAASPVGVIFAHEPRPVRTSAGIAVTTVERTIRDCLDNGTDPYQFRRAIERAEVAGLLGKSVAEVLRGEVAAAGASA